MSQFHLSFVFTFIYGIVLHIIAIRFFMITNMSYFSFMAFGFFVLLIRKVSYVLSLYKYFPQLSSNIFIILYIYICNASEICFCICFEVRV